MLAAAGLKKRSILAGMIMTEIAEIVRRADPPDGDAETMRVLSETTLYRKVDTVDRLKIHGSVRALKIHGSVIDIDSCIRALAEPQYTICARYAWNRPIRIASGARPWATPFEPGALTHAQAFVREMFHVINEQYLYDHIWSLVCSSEDDPFHHDISRFVYDLLDRFYRDDRMSAEWDATSQKMKCVAAAAVPAVPEFVHKTPEECAVDIVRVIMDVLFSGVDAYWPLYPDMRRPKNVLDPDRDWCILFPPEPNKSVENVIKNTIPTWPKRTVVREKLHAFFEREINGHRVVDILTHRVSDDLVNLNDKDRVLLANIAKCATLTAIFLKGKENVRWTF